MHVEWHTLCEWFWKIFSSQGTPAWVQAIGSILALIVAIRVSRLSVEHAASLKQKTIFSIAEAAHKYASDIRNAIELIDDDIGSNVSLYGVYHKDVVFGVIKALQGIPVHELGTSQEVLAILGLTNQLVFLGSATEKLLSDPSVHPELSDAFNSVDSNDYRARQNIRASVLLILKRNAIVHFDEIDKFYKTLKCSLPR